MAISYKNLGNEITSQQAEGLGDYQKILTLANGLVKQRDFFRDARLRDVHYYRDENETEEDAIQLLSLLGSSYQIYIRQTYGNFIIENANLYLENQITAKIRNVLDQNFETVCFQELDLNTEAPILEETTKYLGHYVDERSTHYSNFHYNADGSLFYCEFNFMSDYDTEEFHQDNIHLIREKFVLTDEMYNYYLTAEFLPPLV